MNMACAKQIDMSKSTEKGSIVREVSDSGFAMAVTLTTDQLVLRPLC